MHRAEINENGMATFPLVGDLRVGGLELFLARSVISKAYSAYYVNPPVIMVNLVDSPAEQARVRRRSIPTGKPLPTRIPAAPAASSAKV